jgi:hypothetical protein
LQKKQQHSYKKCIQRYVGTDESDVDTEEDIQPAPGRNANPWFSVIDRETFQLNVEGCVAGKLCTYGI